MPQNTLVSRPVPKTYAALRRAVEIAMIRGQREADLAKVRSYHETGRLIHAHVLLFKDRARRNARTMQRLSEDLRVDRTVLHRCVSFYRAFPYVATWQHIGWAHFRVLIPLADAKLRLALANEADKHEWPVAQLEQRIRSLLPLSAGGGDTMENVTPPKPLVPKRGTVGVWQVIASDDRLAVDLGFTAYVDLPAKTKLGAGDLVCAGGDGTFASAPAATKADLYTYEARIMRVVDGDTLWVKIYLEPGRWLKEKLRLRGIDCPEMDTPEGRAAKRFVETLVATAHRVTITTTKPDKWDRYLSDVFLETDDGDLFLNNHLLANGHARRMDEYSLTDWGE
jgi:endonuclease YncB( thermonuclease family)